METTMLIKTNKALKNEASRIAKELGIPLTTVINAYLGQFIRDQKISLSIEPTLSQKKLRELLTIVSDMDAGKNIGIKTSKKEELFKHLGV